MAWTIYGLVQINYEKPESWYNTWHDQIEDHENYSPIYLEGKTKPRLKIPPYKTKGWKRLTAIYSDEYKEVYLGSIKRTLFFYGCKVWVNCPDIYFLPNEEEVIFKADLFANNRRVPGGSGKFKYHGKTTSPEKLLVVNGYVSESSYTVPKDKYEYQFKYQGSESHFLSEAVGTGHTYLYEVEEGRTPLKVTVPTIILNENETGKLIARVHRWYYESVVNFPDDIPEGGTITFYIDGIKIRDYKTGLSDIPITTSGFASINIKAIYGVGTHNITAVYTPNTPELQAIYSVTRGSGTLFIGTDSNKPKLSAVNTPWCTFIKNENKTLTFKSNKDINGTVKMFMDLEPLCLKNGVSPDYEIEINVAAGETFSLNFDTMGEITSKCYYWNYSGYHNIMMCITVTDDNYDNVPMEYWYYFDDFYIQIPVKIELIGDLDNYSENGVYVGNNLYYLNEDTTSFYKPNTSQRPKSTTVGNPMKIKITNIEHPELPVDEGYVKITVVSRTENNNLEETTNPW